MEVSETDYMSKKKVTVKKTHVVGVFRSVPEELNERSAISPQDSQERDKTFWLLGLVSY